MAVIWTAPEGVYADPDHEVTFEKYGFEVLTPSTDPTANALKKRGRPKGSKNKVRP